jgi:hypothetical protein
MVEIGDIPVRCFAEDESRRQAISDLLATVPRYQRPPAATFIFGAAPPPLPDLPPDKTFDDMRVWRRGPGLFLEDASGVRAQVTGSRCHIGGQCADLSLAFHRLFFPAVTHLVARYERFVLHGAAIVRSSAAWVVLGRSGTGKSTLAMAALASGWRLLGDDMVVVRAGPEGVGNLEVAGITRRTAIPGDLGPRPPGSRAVLDDPRNRWELPAGALTPGWFPIRGVILVGHAAGASGDLEPASPASVLYAVLGSFFSVGEPPLLRRFFPHAAALSRLQGWKLGHGCLTGTRLGEAQRLLGAVQ